MPVTFSPIITDLGQSVFVPLATGIEFTFTHVAVGTGTSAVNSTATALENEIARFPIAGGGINSGGKSASINALITNHTNANPQNYNISEIGFFGLDAASNTILFAIYRQGTTIINKVAGVDIAIPFSLGLGALPTSNITVQLDTNISAMMALLGQHTSLNHPHTQYKRTLNNTERLKIADGVDNDEAVSVGQLSAESMIRAGVDAALAGQIAQEVLDRQAGDTSEATARVNGDLALSIALASEITNRESADNAVLAQLNNVIFGGANYTTFSGTGNTFTIQPNKTIRVILIGGGGGGGAGGGGGSGYGGAGGSGGDSTIYPIGNAANFILKAKGGFGGAAAYGGNGSSYALGGSPDGREVDINNLFDVVILSYQNGLKGNYDSDSPLINHPTVKKLGLSASGRGKRGTHDGYYAIGGGGSGGAFVEAIIVNRLGTPLVLSIDCGTGGTAGVGLNEDNTTINGLVGVDGVCVVIY